MSTERFAEHQLQVNVRGIAHLGARFGSTQHLAATPALRMRRSNATSSKSTSAKSRRDAWRPELSRASNSSSAPRKCVRTPAEHRYVPSGPSLSF